MTYAEYIKRHARLQAELAECKVKLTEYKAKLAKYEQACPSTSADMTRDRWLQLYDLLGPEKTLGVVRMLSDHAWPTKIAREWRLTESICRRAYTLYHGEAFKAYDSEKCTHCAGGGWIKAYHAIVCPECQGTRYNRQQG